MNEQLEDAPEKSERRSDSMSSDLPDTSARIGKFQNQANGLRKTCKQLAAVRVVQSDELLQGKRELRIIHGDEVYRLMVTRNKKLILQK